MFVHYKVLLIASPLLLIATDLLELQSMTNAFSVDSAHDKGSDGINCGRVPIFGRTLGRNINDSDVEMERRLDDDAGNSRILFGLDANKGEWPWVVQLKSCDSSGNKCIQCTGALVNARWILTAAHCTPATSSDSTEVTLSLYDLILPDESTVKVDCDQLVVHPEANLYRNDIALLRLSHPVEYNEFIQPICLASFDSTDSENTSELIGGRQCFSLGYGLNENFGFPNRLQKLEVKGAPCDKLVADVKLDDNTSVCLLPSRADVGGTCRGDSGGPNVCYDRESDRWFVFGVVSFGPSDCNREAPPGEWLTASVDVTKFYDWITETINESDEHSEVED